MSAPPDLGSQPEIVAFNIAAQLRRRREAANRCEPLESGHREPLDGTDIVTTARRYKPVSIRVDDRLILIRGNVRDVLRSAGLKPIYSGVGRGWVLDADKLPDVLASLEHAGFHVTVRRRDAA